jgi:hypothetical protein
VITSQCGQVGSNQIVKQSRLVVTELNCLRKGAQPLHDCAQLFVYVVKAWFSHTSATRQAIDTTPLLFQS